jgi:hypothetical protein
MAIINPRQVDHLKRLQPSFKFKERSLVNVIEASTAYVASMTAAGGMGAMGATGTPRFAGYGGGGTPRAAGFGGTPRSSAMMGGFGGLGGLGGTPRKGAGGVEMAVGGVTYESSMASSSSYGDPPSSSYGLVVVPQVMPQAPPQVPQAVPQVVPLQPRDGKGRGSFFEKSGTTGSVLASIEAMRSSFLAGNNTANNMVRVLWMINVLLDMQILTDGLVVSFLLEHPPFFHTKHD